jgi:hypothetical protein
MRSHSYGTRDRNVPVHKSISNRCVPFMEPICKLEEGHAGYPTLSDSVAGNKQKLTVPSISTLPSAMLRFDILFRFSVLMTSVLGSSEHEVLYQECPPPKARTGVLVADAF